jgi:putative ABC transport system permease protein
MLFETVIRDVRFGARLLSRNRMFAALSIATLALGIGAATTIFSVIQNVLLDPFDFNADRIVTFLIRDAAGTRPGGRSAFQVPEFLDYQAQVQSFEEVIAGATEDVLFSTPQGSEQFVGGRVSVNNFSFLGVRAGLGRTLEPRDAEPGAAPVFVLAHKAWAQYFGNDAGAVGRSFVLNGVPTTLVGVMSRRFRKLGADLYQPAVLDRADEEQVQRFYTLQARLKRGVTELQAEAEIGLVAQRLAKVYPRNYPERFTVKVVSLLDSVVGSFQTTLYTLAAAVGLLLLIACANVANMLLARATTREREMALRASLGASRSRLVRQMLVESLLLALLGTGLGCVWAQFGIQALAAAIPEGLIPQQAVIRLNTPVLLFSLGIAILTSLACGLVPALTAAGKDVVEPLKDSGKGTAGGLRHRRLGDVLVAAEVTLSIVLLVGAGLLARSFVKLQAVDLGFDPKDVLMARVAVPPGQYSTAVSKGQLFRRLLARVQALPGVVAATAVSSVPPFGSRIEVGVPGGGEADKQYASVQLCSEGYFRTLGLRLLHGRLLTEAEVAGARNVAVVNQTLAERYFGTDDPIGHSVQLKELAAFRQSPVEHPSFDIVGVVADTRNQGIREPALPEVFIPHTVTAAFGRGILVKTAGPPSSLLRGLKREVWAVDQSVAVTQSGLVTDYLNRFSYAEPRFSVVVMTVFAAAGLLLVAIGIFSVIAYTVSRRAHEIGIRMALGAERADVVRMVLRTTLSVIGIGIGVGLSASLGVTHVLSSQLFGIAPQDPTTAAAVVGVVIVVGLLASYAPVRQATRVDPMIALRHE